MKVSFKGEGGMHLVLTIDELSETEACLFQLEKGQRESKAGIKTPWVLRLRKKFSRAHFLANYEVSNNFLHDMNELKVEADTPKTIGFAYVRYDPTYSEWNVQLLDFCSLLKVGYSEGRKAVLSWRCPETDHDHLAYVMENVLPTDGTSIEFKPKTGLPFRSADNIDAVPSHSCNALRRTIGSPTLNTLALYRPFDNVVETKELALKILQANAVALQPLAREKIADFLISRRSGVLCLFDYLLIHQAFSEGIQLLMARVTWANFYAIEWDCFDPNSCRTDNPAEMELLRMYKRFLEGAVENSRNGQYNLALEVQTQNQRYVESVVLAWEKAGAGCCGGESQGPAMSIATNLRRILGRFLIGRMLSDVSICISLGEGVAVPRQCVIDSDCKAVDKIGRWAEQYKLMCLRPPQITGQNC